MVRIYSLLDKKVPCFTPPYHAPSDGVALRNLSTIVTDPKSQLCLYAGDYDLYYLGDMDENLGQLIPCNPPRIVMSLLNLKISLEANHERID